MAFQLHEALPVPSSAPAGHLLPRGEGKKGRTPRLGKNTEATALAPLLRERGWGEGTERSLRGIPTARGFARTRIRPCGAPSPEGRRENTEATALAPLLRERGWGEGTERSPRGVPTARSFARALIRPFGHLLPMGEGKNTEATALAPLLRERGWGEGTERSPRGVPTARGFARTRIRPFGAPSPEGRRENTEATALAPLLRERGWGEGTERSPRGVPTARGFARTLIRPCGAHSPEGRRDGSRRCIT